MNRINKHRYIFKDTQGTFSTQVFTLEEIEGSRVWTYWKNRNLEIVARCQFTGLKDKNGAEIYDKDVIRNKKYEFNALIMWGFPNESYAGWCFKRLDEKTEYPRMGLLYNNNLENCKVIGSSIMNPELLTQDKGV